MIGVETHKFFVQAIVSEIHCFNNVIAVLFTKQKNANEYYSKRDNNNKSWIGKMQRSLMYCVCYKGGNRNHDKSSKHR